MFFNLLVSFLSFFNFKTPILIDQNLSFPQESIDEVYVPIGNNDDIYGDEYENNDSTENAVDLCPENYYELDSYCSHIDASLDTSALICDIDYFYFKLLTDSEVTISFTSLNDYYSANLSVFSFQYLQVENGLASKNYDFISENYSLTKEKISSFDLTPGTYFIFLSCQQENNSEITVDYSLNLSVKKSGGYFDSNINDLHYNKGLKAALWISITFL